MTTTTMHFGPEWMRKAPSRVNPSPPLATPATTAASTYSALVAPASQSPPEKPDPANPFRYSKEDMIRIYKEGGGKGGLGLEVERWEGIVREIGSDPIALKDMSEAEKKIFTGPLNSEMRRRASTDYLSLSTTGLGERPKLGLNSSAAPASPMRERLGGFMGRRRDSTDQPPLSLPRKLSQSSLQPPLASPRDALPSPRRLGSGFDGVLSDSWSSRRRASEGLSKGSGRSGDTGDPQDEPKAVGIKEEDEDIGATRLEASNSSGGISASHSDQPSDSPVTHGGGLGQTASDTLSSGINNLSLDARAQNSPLVPSTTDGILPGPPPGLADPTTMEWSYLDPQGNVQGPFPAPTMQKWHDDGYFTPNLLMKRANLDTEWTSVGDLLQRAGNPRLFLTPLAPSLPPPPPPPPAFPRRDPLLDGPVQDGSFGSPFQPVPTRSLRTSTLDSYLHNGSMVPDSPSSSFSVGRFSNDSPDPAAFGSRLGNMYSGSPVGSRLGFTGVQSNGLEPQRRTTYDTVVDPLLARQGYANYTQRTGSTDGLGFNDTFSPGLSNAYMTSNTSQVSLTDKSDDFSSGRGFAANPQSTAQSPFINTDLGPGIREGPRLIKRELFERTEPQSAISNQFLNGNIGFPAGQPFAQSQPIPYTPQPDARSLQQQMPSTPDRPSAASLAHQPSFASAPSQSPWPSQEGLAPRRPGPFDPNYPTSRNTVAVKPNLPVQPAQPQTQPVVPATVPAKHSPWFSASQVIAGEGWGTDKNSLTAANLGQHNKQQEPSKVQLDTLASPDSQPVAQPEPIPQPQQESEAVVASLEVTALTPKSRRKQGTTAVAAVSTLVQPVDKPSIPQVPSPKPPSPVAVSGENKSPWSIEEEKKPLSLREIQDLELKKTEARKTVERERLARAAAAASPPIAEDTHTISWGLPTSQVGNRVAKEAISSSPIIPTPGATLAPPVWTNAVKPSVVKKTMKEIQEEEEKRKRLAAKEKETVVTASRRAYADTTTKAPVPAQVGGAWTTVGVSGKGATAAPTRPVIPTASLTTKVAPTAATPTLTAASLAARSPAITPNRSPVVTAAIKLAPVTKDETPAPPSHEFLKWMAEALKGLNSTVNLEEITSMLLTFPMDPDPSTVEVISDLIYCNSTTLDGRRFATEFVSKRKADSKGSSSAVSGKPLSIADVVKTQPKPAQNEWGGFKVVNKKKKGARA
ncbi:hypothetical protein BC835DRAFT_1327310 [Cytidiella melzeri]|nr:hypothetical protein BC835DRAFT_1327310 [Cytidiella melzeri]